MAATLLKLLCALFFVNLINPGNCQCGRLSNFNISQTQTGAQVKGQPQWKVTILNDCICTKYEIKLACDGFQTLEKIDPSILAKTGSDCLINNGQPISGFKTFSFTYAWASPYPFKVKDASIACS